MGNEKSIPQELILKILMKLPVKSVVRFKCAHKSWLSLISDPLFAKSHYQLSASPTHLLISLESSSSRSLQPSPSQALAIDLDASLANHSVVTEFHLQWFRGYNIRGCCRGFLLLENRPFLSLWNPSTNAFRETSYYPFPLNNISSKFVFGFGYHDSTDDYLIFVAWINFRTIIPSVVLEIYSARAGSWKLIELPNFLYTILNYRKPGLVYNGAIHRLVRDLREKTILALDWEARIFSTIPFPSDALVRRNSEYEDLSGVRDGAIYDLKVIGECLSLFRGGESIEIWVMKEYKVESSWTKYFYMEEVSIGTLFYPIYLTKGGECVGLNESRDLVKLNDKGEVLEHGPCYEDDQIAMYTPTLLSLPPPDFQEEEDGGKQGQQPQRARRIKGANFRLKPRKVKRHALKK